jgi:hypothetical protein
MSCDINEERERAEWDKQLFVLNPYATAVDAWDQHLFELNPFASDSAKYESDSYFSEPDSYLAESESDAGSDSDEPSAKRARCSGQTRPVRHPALMEEGKLLSFILY